ncbi:MAG: nitroreductase family protein [Chloroflexota bacterium]|nr:nitroreductase family protein [Chloroflexota bacterium]
MHGNSNSRVSDKIRFLKGLRAVRQFLPEPVPQEVIDDILEVARWTGSSTNSQPWDLIVVRDRQMLQTLSQLEGSIKYMANAAFAIVIVMAGENKNTEPFDEGRLVERMLLAASAHGVGAGLGWLRGTGRDDAKRLLGVPESRSLRATISFGYQDKNAPRDRPKPEQPRKPLSEIVHLERF